MAKQKKSKSPKKTVTLNDLQAELKAINRKLDFCVARLGPGELSDEPTRREFAGIAKTGEALEDEAEEAFAAGQARKK